MAERATASRYNDPLTILFLHGRQSIPGGFKPRYIAQHGYEVVNPALPHDDFSEALRMPRTSSTRTSRMWLSARHEAAQWP
jgi:hypothetical protein